MTHLNSILFYEMCFCLVVYLKIKNKHKINKERTKFEIFLYRIFMSKDFSKNKKMENDNSSVDASVSIDVSV